MGASRSMVLAPPSPRTHRYALPPNHVLPPAPRHRLRPTHNGNALLEAGTIRGLLRDRPFCQSEPDIARRDQATPTSHQRRRSFGIEGGARGNRPFFHSDPDIAGRVTGVAPPTSERRRSFGVGGGAASDRKCRKKKSRAPQPPPPETASCRCIVLDGHRASGTTAAKTKAPPPPPPPEETATKTAASTTRTRESSGYEKKVPPLEKWRHCRSAGDVRSDEAGCGRTTVFDSRKLLRPPDAFQEEIREATRQRARHVDTNSSPPKFYFGEKEAESRQEKKTPLQRFSPCRTRVRSPTPPPLHHDIDLRLRPVLPRKPPQVTNFSSSDAWRALGSSSDEDDGRQANDWTPRMDLSDDDASGDEGEKEEGTTDIISRFPLPAVMFSNRRPLGASLLPSYTRGNDRQKSRFPAKEDANWTFGLQNRGKQYSSEVLLSSKKKHALLKDFGDFLLGDLLAAKSRQSSEFSFYSTDGRVTYSPDRRRFETADPPFVTQGTRKGIKKGAVSKKGEESEACLRRDLQLARMLEEEGRRRRNREKAGLRQELQRLKQCADDDDEAYFTEPKSRDDEEFSFGPPYSGSTTALDSASSRLSHWQSSPALLGEGQSKVREVVPPPKTAWSSSSSPSPVPPPHHRRRNSDSVYRRLMDIVRKEEERQHTQGATDSSERSTTSSASTSSDCSGRMPKEDGRKSFLQPYSHYRPVAFHATSMHQALPRKEAVLSA